MLTVQRQHQHIISWDVIIKANHIIEILYQHMLLLRQHLLQVHPSIFQQNSAKWHLAHIKNAPAQENGIYTGFAVVLTLTPTENVSGIF